MESGKADETSNGVITEVDVNAEDVHPTIETASGDEEPEMVEETDADVKSATKTEAELLSDQISELVTIESSSQERRLNDEIECMLVKITEFMEVVEMIRSDTNICVISNLPLVTGKSRQLQETFDKIDALEVFVAHIDEILKKLEAQAEGAEAHFNTFSSLKKKFFGALSNIGKKHQDTSLQHQTSQTEPRQPLEAVEIFNTADFFPSS